MTTLNVVEIAVHLGSFRNVDLFHQGVYRLHVFLYQEPGEAAAQPACIAPAQAVKMLPPVETEVEENCVLPACLSYDHHADGSFLSRAFLIRLDFLYLYNGSVRRSMFYRWYCGILIVWLTIVQIGLVFGRVGFRIAEQAGT